MVDAPDNSKRWVISTRDETREAVIAIAKEAKRKVSIFTHDLEPGIYDDPDFLDLADNRDFVEALDNITTAENQQLQNYVDYEIARLRIIQQLGLMFIDQGGRIVS